MRQEFLNGGTPATHTNTYRGKRRVIYPTIKGLDPAAAIGAHRTGGGGLPVRVPLFLQGVLLLLSLAFQGTNA